MNTGSLQLLETEATSQPELDVVLDRGTMDNGSQKTSSGARCNTTGFLNASTVTALLAHRLVEPCLDVSLPILVEMAIGDDVVSFASHLA